MLLGKLVESADVGVQQRRHLVDERACTAGAGAVHTLLKSAGKISYLCVLAAQLYCDVRLRNQLLYGVGACGNLLHERNAEPLGNRNSSGTGNSNEHSLTLKILADLPDDIIYGLADIGEMPSVLAVQQFVILSEHRRLNSC